MTSAIDGRQLEYRRRTDVDFELLDDEALIWDERHQSLHRICGAPAAAWLACSQWAGVGEIAAALDDTSSDVAGVAAYLNDLAARHLVDRRPVSDG